MFCRWHSCHTGHFHKGLYSSSLCRPCHWDTRHHVGIPQFWLWKEREKISFYQMSANYLCCWLTLHTAPERIPCKARWTLALGLVVLYIAGCVGATWIWDDTWIGTISKIASLISWALFVWLTTNRFRYDCWEWRKKEFVISWQKIQDLSCLLTDFLTALISFSCVPWYAGAGHSSEWKGVVNCAFCVAGTGRYCLAGIFAFFLQTGLPARAVFVCCTFNLWYRNCWSRKNGFEKNAQIVKKIKFWCLLLLQTEPYGFPV